MKRTRTKALLVAFATVAVLMPAPTADQGDLDRLLLAAGRYCQRMENSFLEFFCREEIVETLFLPYKRFDGNRRSQFRSQSNRYTYDYQLIKKGIEVSEQRILLRENGRDCRVPDAKLQTKVFTHHQVALGPIGLLSTKRQPLYRYQLAGEEKVAGEKALVVLATPVAAGSPDQLAGKIWFRKGDGAILRIEWRQTSIGNYELVQYMATKYDAEPDISFVSEYGVEHSGMRFPSRYAIQEDYITEAGARLCFSQTTVQYDQYRFFTVSAQEREVGIAPEVKK